VGPGSTSLGAKPFVREFMAKRRSVVFFLILIPLLICAHAGPLQAGRKSFRILLLAGTAVLLDGQRQVPAAVGLILDAEKFDSLALSPGSRIYLQSGRELLLLEKQGSYRLVDIEHQPGSLLTDTLRFLSALAEPRAFTQQVRVRGSQESEPQDDAAYFEHVWEQVVQSGPAVSEAAAEQDALAAAAWFHQRGAAARTAFILEHLDNASQAGNPFFRQLRNDALRGIPLAAINREVEQTRQALAHRNRQFRYQALLIGIDRYDHPAWQNLDNPISDVRSLRRVLIDRYRFQPEDIAVLENPTFADIIDGFQNLKQTVDDQTRLIIYFAGHGYYPADEEEGYWIPSNGGDPGTQKFFIPTSIILSKMKAIKSRHTLLITDSCFSGSLIRKSRGAVIDSGFYRELSAKRGRQIITSGGLEPVSDSGSGDHSVFAGSLLRILSEERSSPLSASELAIELRKSLKNAGVQQTPEYGRLFTADDESGEFFFVSKEQPPAYAERKPEVRTAAPSPENGLRELDIIGMRNPPQNDGSAFQARSSEEWFSIGLIYHQGFMEYNTRYAEPGGAPRKISISTSLEGRGLKAEARRTNYKGSYGVTFDFGQFVRLMTCANNDTALAGIGIKTCDEQEQADHQSRTTLSGYFSHLGAFTDYSVLVWREFSIQLGGSIELQYYQLSDFLESDSLNSSTLGACGKGGLSYRNSGWTSRLLLDFCLATFEISGSLHELNEDQASSVRLLAGMRAGLEAGFQF